MILEFLNLNLKASFKYVHEPTPKRSLILLEILNLYLIVWNFKTPSWQILL